MLRTATNYLRALTTVDGEQPGGENLQQLYRSFDTALSHIGEVHEQPAEVTKPVAVPTKAVPIAADKGITSDDRKRSIIRVPLEKLDDLEAALHDLVVAGSGIERRLADLEQQINELHNTSSRLQATSGKIESSFEADMLGRERVLDISIHPGIPTKQSSTLSSLTDTRVSSKHARPC